MILQNLHIYTYIYYILNPMTEFLNHVRIHEFDGPNQAFQRNRSTTRQSTEDGQGDSEIYRYGFDA